MAKERAAKSPAEINAENERMAAVEAEGWSRPERASGGEILEWGTGKVVVGKLRNIKRLPDKVEIVKGVQQTQTGGRLMTLTTDEGDQVYGCPTLLYQIMERVEIGTMCRIYCLGKVVKTRRGQPAWDFEVSFR